ncbi:MAG: ABC transporter ATP-binding protein, partial [Rhodocyclaceae bacterium]|nr:ABC transporter ATP-binding protein [Rhodocyclaceae bacterium]
RNRLLLARLFAQPANVLVLDEPTNDLDIETLDLLEALLTDYAGTLFLVSHDRAFLDNTVTQVIAAEGDGVWREYAGGYADWQRLRQERQAAAARPGKAGGKDKPRAAATREKKLSFNEKRELDALPDRITALEAEEARLHAQLADPALYQKPPEAAVQLKARLDAVSAQMAEAMARWEVLEALAGD